MKIKKVRCKRDYRFLNPGEIAKAANAIKGGIYRHPGKFPDPGITEDELAASIKEHSDIYAAYKGHTRRMADMTESFDKLVHKLNLLADYVDKKAENNSFTIALSGFIPTLQYVGKKEVPVQCKVTVKMGNSRELITNCQKVVNADYYGAILTDKPLPWGTYIDNGKLFFSKATAVLQDAVVVFDLTRARKKSFKNLDLGKDYYVYYWAGNAKGISPLSDVVEKKVIE
jgi:hypothetical protein